MDRMKFAARFVPRTDAASRIRALYKGKEKPTEEMEKSLGFSKEELEEVKDVFRYFDSDRNKYLDPKECQCLFNHQVGSALEKSAFEKVFKKMDQNSDGLISFPEYLQHLSSRKKKFPSTYEIEDTFNLFDRNEDGLLNLSDVRNALLYLGEDAGRSDMRAIFVQHDGDKDGLITRFEFQDLLQQNFPR